MPKLPVWTLPFDTGLGVITDLEFTEALENAKPVEPVSFKGPMKISGEVTIQFHLDDIPLQLIRDIFLTE